ncbi:MAG: TIR domain-containing protein [Rubrivivax sp.]
MSAIFISHSSRDDAFADELKTWLYEQGYRSLFLDFDPADGIPAGRHWEQELYRQLRACHAVIVLCSEASMESDWCFAEITHARALGKLIFPLRIDACRLRAPLAELQVIDATTDRAGAFARLLRGLRTAGLEQLFALDPARPPYPGLMAFQEADAAVYFGRESEIRTALDALTRLRRFDGSRLLVFLGASGSGKSSLLRAGLLPRLRQARTDWVLLPALRPLQRPLDELALTLASALGAATGNWQSIATRLEQAGSVPADAASLWAGWLRDLRHGAGAGDQTLVFSIDQFEEALVATPQAERFLRLVEALVTDPDRQAVVLATLRSDFLEALQTHPSFRAPFDTLPLGALGVDALVQVIEGPAQAAGLEVERGLTERLVADTGTDDGLPLLAFTLRELWERDAAGGRLTIATYRDALGGLQGAIARAAEGVVDINRLDDAQRRDMQAAFLALVRINDAGQYTRQAVRWDDLPAGAHSPLGRFVDARLLVSSGEAQGRVVEVAHEALFRVWQRLREWLDADREWLRLRDGVRRAAAEWDEKARPADLLVHRGSRLDDAETLLREGRIPLEPVPREYLQACIAAREAERAADRLRADARRRRVRFTLGGLAAGMVVAIGLSMWAMRERAQATERLADLSWISGIGDRDVGHDPLKALHHFAQAATLSKDPDDVRSAVFASRLLRGNAALQAVIEPPGGIGHAAFDVDASQIVVWSPTGAAAQWTSAGTPPRVLRAPLQVPPQRLFPSPRARWQVLVDAGSGPAVVDVLTAQIWLQAPPSTADPVFDESESRVAIRDDRVVRVWQAPEAAPRATLEHPARVDGAVFSSDGRQMLTWDSEHVARLWAIDGSQRLAEWRAPAEIVGGAVADGGNALALWGRQAPVSLWHPKQGATVPLRVAGDTVPNFMGARFVAGGRELLTWNYGGPGTARLWDARSGAQRLQVSHTQTIGGMAPDRSGQRLLSWSADSTAAVWDARDGARLALFEHRAVVRGASFSADGTRVLTWSDDATAGVWDAGSGRALSLPLHHAGGVIGAMWAAGDRSVLSWDASSARVWRIDASDGVRVASLRSAGPAVQAAFGAADGEVLTLASEGRLQRWLDARAVGAAVDLPRDLVGAAFDRERKRVVTWGPGPIVEILAVDTAQPMTPPMHHERSDFGIRGAAFDSDGRRVLSWGDDRSARLWDADSGRSLAVLLHPAPVAGAAFGSDATRAVTWAEDRVVRVWELPGGALVNQWPPAPFGIGGATLARGNSRLMTWDSDGTLRSFDVASGRPLGEWRHDAGTAVVGAQASRDERRLLSWDEHGGVRVWDLDKTSRSEPTAAWQVPALHGATLSHDARWVLSWGGNGARLWDSRTGQALSSPFGPDESMVGAALRNDDRALLTWSAQVVRIWDFDADLGPLERDAAPRVQWRSGTRLDRNGQIQVLGTDVWTAVRDRLGSTTDKR